VPTRVALALVVGLLASLLLFSCGHDGSPTAPATPLPTSPTAAATPTPTETPLAAANIAGAWNASITSPQPGCDASFRIILRQSGNNFNGSETEYYGESTILSRSVVGTIAGSTLRGTFDETHTIYVTPVNDFSGEFEGAILSPNTLNISISNIQSTVGGPPRCQSESIAFTR
jgi:hypothetical protein